MTGNQGTFSVRATLMHAPELGTVEIIADALIEVDGSGGITTITRPDDAEYDQRLEMARSAGTLHTVAPDCYLLPGLIDLHIHAPQWPQLGKALHLPLYDWLSKHTFPLEARYADTAFARQVYASLVETLIANGTTTAVYFGTVHREANKALAEICMERGQRAFVGKVAMDDPEQCPDYYRDASAAEAVDETAHLIEHIRTLAGNEAGLVKPIVTPRFIPSCSDNLLTELGALAQSTGCHIQTHCSESDWEHGFVIERLGKSDTHALHDFGLLTRHTVLAHSNFISSDDCSVIGKAGAGVAHCPLSNFYFANSVFPLRSALEKGVRVGLGTDISGGPSASMFDSCRNAIAASRALEEGVNPARPAAERGTPDARIDFRHAFWLATTGGADVLDIPAGRFAPGLQFDAMVIDTGTASSNITVWRDIDTEEDILQKIVYGATRSSITEVWIAGRRVHACDTAEPEREKALL